VIPNACIKRRCHSQQDRVQLLFWYRIFFVAMYCSYVLLSIMLFIAIADYSCYVTHALAMENLNKVNIKWCDTREKGVESN